MVPSGGIPIKISDKVVGTIQIDEELFASTCGAGSLEVLKNAGDLLAIALKSAGLERDMSALNNIQSDFISSFPHELRIPITVIKDSLHMLLEEALGKVNDDQMKILKLASSNVERLWRLSEELLDLSAIASAKTPMKRSLFDIAGLSAVAVMKYQSIAKEKGVLLAAALPGTKIEIWGDEDKLDKAICYLIDNAIRYTAKNGRVDVRMQDTDKWVMVHVSDTGAGISPEDIGRVMDKFYRVTMRASGEAKKWGIGLPIVKEIVVMHGGDIAIESEVGKGSTFTMTLPKSLR